LFLFLGRRDVSRGERDGHRDGFSSKSKSRFRVSVALHKRSHARPASIAAGTVCERKQQRRASSLGRRAARGVPREVPRRRRAPPAGARPDGRAARAETGAHFSRAAARRPSRSPLVDGSSDSVFKKPRARHISSVELRASLATLDAPAAATPFAASAPLSRACFGTSWDVRRELRGGGARALPRVSAIQPTQRKKGARLAHQLS